MTRTTLLWLTTLVRRLQPQALALAARPQTLRDVARRSSLGHPIHSIQRAFPYSAFRVDDDTLTSSKTRRVQHSIGGTALRVLSSCLVSGSHPSLEHGAVGNMKACLDSSCSLHRDFGCRLRVVLPVV